MERVTDLKASIEKSRLEIQRLLTDPTLEDLNKDITLQEISHLLSYEQKEGIRLKLVRPGLRSIRVYISTRSKVSELKELIELSVTRETKRDSIKTRINWRYIWNSNYLLISSGPANGKVLKLDNKTIKEYGVEEDCEISFCQRIIHGKRKS